MNLTSPASTKIESIHVADVLIPFAFCGRLAHAFQEGPKSDSWRVSLELNHEERQLILKYGYADPSFEEALLAVPDDEDLATVTCRDFLLDLLLGDLAHAIIRCKDVDLQYELDDLYCHIERSMSKR